VDWIYRWGRWMKLDVELPQDNPIVGRLISFSNYNR
jgi:hypothetical protein